MPQSDPLDRSRTPHQRVPLLPLAPSLPTSWCYRQPGRSRVVACHSGRYCVSVHRHFFHRLPLPLLPVAQGCSQHTERAAGCRVPQGLWNANYSFSAAAVFAPKASTRPRPWSPRHVQTRRWWYRPPPHHERPLWPCSRELSQRCPARPGIGLAAATGPAQWAGPPPGGHPPRCTLPGNGVRELSPRSAPPTPPKRWGASDRQ